VAHDVYALVCSLGYRATLRSGRARGQGRDCGPKWTIALTTPEAVFWPTRKQSAQAVRTANARPSRHRYRYIAEIPRGESDPVHCIRVAAASSLFLAGALHGAHALLGSAERARGRRRRPWQGDRRARSHRDGEYAMGGLRHQGHCRRHQRPHGALSLDPPRMYGPGVGSRITQSFLTALLKVAPTSDRGVLLADVLDAGYLAQHQLSGLENVLAQLEHDCKLEGACDLARPMRVFARRDFGRVSFDNSLPPLTPDSPATIIRPHTLELPNREELLNRHLLDQMRLEKIFGRATYALIAGLAMRAPGMGSRGRLSPPQPLASDRHRRAHGRGDLGYRGIDFFWPALLLLGSPVNLVLSSVLCFVWFPVTLAAGATSVGCGRRRGDGGPGGRLPPKHIDARRRNPNRD
jgi:hypothetical protein